MEYYSNKRQDMQIAYERHTYKVLVEIPKKNRPLGKPRYRWQDMKMDPEEIGMECCGFDSSGLGQGPVTGSCEHGNKPSGSKKMFGIS
jgi:hypothetical protein